MEAGEARAAAARGKVRIGSQAARRLGLCAVIDGVLAAPVMIIMMLLVRRKSVMGDLEVKGPIHWLGWISTAAMGLCIVGMAMSMWSS
jgi:Mn2+/Fe2+ NRAMP family transporter